MSFEEKVLPFYQDTGCGLKISGSFDLEAFESALTYEPRPDDIFIVTYPKCGTTWVQGIVSCIFRKGRPFAGVLDYLANSPFLEMSGAEAAETMERPGAIKIHMPFHLIPWSPRAKYIYVARNPKDCCVSFYHHTKILLGYKFKNGKFDDFFELFIEGKVDFGDYFDHLISWYEHRNDPNVLFLTYEDLKKNTRTNILKIAEFMGDQYKDMLMKDEKLMVDVIKNSSFDFMKGSLGAKLTELTCHSKDFVENQRDISRGVKTLLTCGDKFFDSDPDSSFMRKGAVGDYKNYFSPEQNRRLEEKFRERTKGTDIPELWKDIMNVSYPSPLAPCAKPFSQLADSFSVDRFCSALSYKPRPDDVFIVTYPNCGTTWAQQIVLLIFRQGEPLSSQLEFFTAAPYLEMSGAEAIEKMLRPGTIKVHLPYHLTPRSEQAKYIYVSRNPKDCCVSYFHSKQLLVHSFNGNFDDYFENFMSGNTDFGDYFDHLLGWYAHRNDPNVLFMTYEEMREKPEEAVLKIASFIDDKKYATPLRRNPEKLKKIIQYSCFQYMKEVINNNLEIMLRMCGEELLNADLPDGVKELFCKLQASSRVPRKNAIEKNSGFIPKGTSRDWENYFTEEQSKRMDQKFARKTKGTALSDIWKKHM